MSEEHPANPPEPRVDPPGGAAPVRRNPSLTTAAWSLLAAALGWLLGTSGGHGWGGDAPARGLVPAASGQEHRAAVAAAVADERARGEARAAAVERERNEREASALAAMLAVAERTALENQGQREEIHRLRQQLLDRERRIAALTEALGSLRTAVPTQPPAVTVSRTAERTADAALVALNRALLGSGLIVLERGTLRDGVLHDLLVATLGPDGLPQSGERWERAATTLIDGVPRFVLERRRATGETDAEAGDGSEVERREVELPLADAALWAAAGLPLPDGGPTLAVARAALEELLAGQPYELLALAGVRDDELLGLELRELDAQGRELRRMRADRARVQPQGPALLLLDGEVTAAGVTRAFFRGKLVLPLPGAAYSDWLAALFG